MIRIHGDRDDVDPPDLDVLIAGADAKFVQLSATELATLRRDAERAERDRQDGEGATGSLDEIVAQRQTVRQTTEVVRWTDIGKGRPLQSRDGRKHEQVRPGHRRLTAHDEAPTPQVGPGTDDTFVDSARLSDALDSLMIADLSGYGTRSDEDQRWLRKELYTVLEAVMAASGIDCPPGMTQDRGDSIILLIPAMVPKRTITEKLVHNLERELDSHARRSTAPVRMRLRLALHTGEVAMDDRGWIGRDLNTACRLADLDAGRQALAETPEANLVVVVSESWYRGVVFQDPVLVEQFAFRRVPFVAKEVDDHAWIHVSQGNVVKKAYAAGQHPEQGNR